MVWHDAPFREMTFNQMEENLRPKVAGSINLEELFPEDSLHVFVLSSSLASVLGKYGQANYTAADSFMTSLAAQRRQRGLAASSIEIWALLGVGYITQEPDQVG